MGIGRWCSQRTCLRRPRPSAASAENKSAPPWPRHIGRGVGAFLFPQGKARYAERGRKKSLFAGAILPWSDRASPFFLSGRVGTKVKNAYHQYFTAVRRPNDCCPRKRHVWGTRQSRWFRGPAALLCVRAARRVLRPARIRILTAHAPICSRIYLPASSRRQRELGATKLRPRPTSGPFCFFY